MIYVLRFSPAGGEEWIKLGSSKNLGQRIVDSLYSNSHPPALCNRLSKELFEVLACFAGGKEEERELQLQFNAGVLPLGDSHNEFYDVLEPPKIMRDLDTYFVRREIPTELPFPWRMKEMRPCCTGRKLVCRYCKADHFISTFNRDRHELYSCGKNTHRQTEKCRSCDKILGTAEAARKHENQHCPKKQRT